MTVSHNNQPCQPTLGQQVALYTPLQLLTCSNVAMSGRKYRLNSITVRSGSSAIAHAPAKAANQKIALQGCKRYAWQTR